MDPLDIARLDPFRIPGRDTYVPSASYWTDHCPFELEWSAVAS